MKLSVTRISTYQSCPRKYWYSYTMKIETPKSEGFFFGSAIHAGLENFYNRKDPMQGVNNSLFGKKTTIGEQAKEGVDPYKLHKQAKNIFEAYPDKATYFKPKLVENWFTVPLIHPETKEKLPCLLTGKMDLVTADEAIVDHKTTNNPNSTFFDKQNELQASGYSYAYFMKFGELPKKFIYNLIVKGNSRREPSFHTKILTVTLGDICFFFDTCKEVFDAIDRGETQNYPNTSHCRWCRFKNICPMKVG